MIKRNNLNSTQPNLDNFNNYKEPNLWVRGKQENKKFLSINLKKGTNFKTFIFGLIIAIFFIFPFALITYQYIEVYKWNSNSFRLFLAVAWVLILLMNGLSNMFTVKLAKVYAEDIVNLQEIDENAIFFYQTLNPGFSIFVFILFLIFGARML